MKAATLIMVGIMAITGCGSSSGSDPAEVPKVTTKVKQVSTYGVDTSLAIDIILDIEYLTDRERLNAYSYVALINKQKLRLTNLLDTEPLRRIFTRSDYRMSEIVAELSNLALDLEEHTRPYINELDLESQIILKTYLKKALAIYAQYEKALNEFNNVEAAFRVLLLAQELTGDKF